MRKVRENCAKDWLIVWKKTVNVPEPWWPRGAIVNLKIKAKRIKEKQKRKQNQNGKWKQNQK